MVKRMGAIALIYILVSAAWFVLGGSVLQRTWHADESLEREVSALWGATQTQVSPQLAFVWHEDLEEKESVENSATKAKSFITRLRRVERSAPVILDRSKVAVDFQMDHRRKGLLWYATYRIDFQADYAYRNEEQRDGELVITYCFPTQQALYSDFRFEVDGKEDPRIVPLDENGSKTVRRRVPVRQGETVPFRIAYRSQGLDWWRYSFGSDVNRVKNFELAMTTDFQDIDFPQGTISPQTRTATPTGWRLGWESENLISGFQIGMEMPRKLNPGPLAARISFFAPVCLGFFFVWMFVISLLRRIDLHPMNYLFLAAAFFAFHLLLAYTADHLDVRLAFLLASLTSVFLVVSYLRLVVGIRFAAFEAGVSQLVYLVLFSYAHFFEGMTGLIVTIGSILTLFLLMQVTGRIRWSDKFRALREPPPGERPLAHGTQA